MCLCVGSPSPALQVRRVEAAQVRGHMWRVSAPTGPDTCPTCGRWASWKACAECEALKSHGACRVLTAPCWLHLYGPTRPTHDSASLPDRRRFFGAEQIRLDKTWNWCFDWESSWCQPASAALSLFSSLWVCLLPFPSSWVLLWSFSFSSHSLNKDDSSHLVLKFRINRYKWFIWGLLRSKNLTPSRPEGCRRIHRNPVVSSYTALASTG